MKRLIVPTEKDDSGYSFYETDIERLIAVAKQQGYELDAHTAKWAWEDYSDMYAAGWLGMDSYSDYELVSILKNRLDIEETYEEDMI